MSWSIVEIVDPARAKAFEGLFTLGSGPLHVRGSVEDHPAASPQNVDYSRRATNVTSERFTSTPRWGAYVPGLFAPHPTLGPQMVNLPFFLGLDLEHASGERLHSGSPRVRSHRRELRLDLATLTRVVEFQGPSGERLSASFERFVSAEHPHLCVQRLTLTSDRATSLRVRSTIDADVRTNGYDHAQRVRLEAPGEGTILCTLRTDAGDEVRIESATTGTWEEVRATREPRRAHLLGRVMLRPGIEAVIEKRTLVTTSRDLAQPAATIAVLRTRTFESLLDAHSAIWRDRWSRAGVEIEGDDESRLSARACVFHLLRAHVDDDRVAIDAKGFAGEAYWGRFFWDTEVFLLPFHLYTEPARARSLVDFRVRTLDAAVENARRYGYRGAKFPWEADTLGRECCPNWPYADHEVHVSADVAYAFAHFAAAADPAYLLGPAARVVVETARFWMDRMDTREGDAHASILGVMGPDEYAPITHNNAYTNWMAAFNLRLASQVGAAGGATSVESAEFGWAAARLGLVRAADGVLILQCEGFDRLADPRFEELWKDRALTFGANVPQERLFRSRCLKQADVLMMMHLFPDSFTDEEVRRAWDYYLPLTTHDSSLSPAVHSIIASRLGLSRDAWAFWQRGSRIDLEGSGASEGVHIAAAGGVWQMAVFGFAGLRSALVEDDPTLNPRLPEAWTALTFPLAWRGARLRVRIEKGRASVTNEGGRATGISVWGAKTVVGPSETAEFSPVPP